MMEDEKAFGPTSSSQSEHSQMEEDSIGSPTQRRRDPRQLSDRVDYMT